MIGPEMPKETTGPKSGSSRLRIAIGYAGRRVLLDDVAGLLGLADDLEQVLPGVAHLGGRVDVAPHVRQVRPLADPLGGGLEDDVPAQLAAGLLGLAQRRDRAAPPSSSIPYAASSSVSASASRSTPSGLAASARPITCWAAAGSTALGVGRRAVRGAQPDGVLDHPRQRADGGLDRGVGRHRAAARGGAGHVGDAEQLGDALGAEERRDQRLVGLLPHRGQHVGDLLAGDAERRDVDHDHRVDVRVVDGVVEGVLEVLRRGLGAQGDLLVDHEPDRGRGVRGEQPQRVGVADDRDPAAARQRLVRRELGDVEHVLEGVHLDHPGLPEHRVDGLRRRRDLADRVAHRDALGGAAGADRDDRLAQARPGGRCGRTCAGFRSTRGTSSRPRSTRPPPSTAGGRCRTRRRGCRR